MRNKTRSCKRTAALTCCATFALAGALFATATTAHAAVPTHDMMAIFGKPGTVRPSEYGTGHGEAGPGYIRKHWDDTESPDVKTWHEQNPAMRPLWKYPGLLDTRNAFPTITFTGGADNWPNTYGAGGYGGVQIRAADKLRLDKDRTETNSGWNILKKMLKCKIRFYQ